jgi:hypothetical protein
MSMTTALDVEQDWAQAWTDALSALEMDIAACERLLHAVHAGTDLPDSDGTLGAWVPPTGIGPLPETMAERARTVLARQLEVAQALAQAASQSRQQLDFADKVQTGRSPARPVFVDAAF